MVLVPGGRLAVGARKCCYQSFLGCRSNKLFKIIFIYTVYIYIYMYINICIYVAFYTDSHGDIYIYIYMYIYFFFFLFMFHGIADPTSSFSSHILSVEFLFFLGTANSSHTQTHAHATCTLARTHTHTHTHIHAHARLDAQDHTQFTLRVFHFIFHHSLSFPISLSTVIDDGQSG